MKKLAWLIIVCLMIGCSSNSEKEIFQGSRDVVVDVSQNVKKLNLGDVLIGSVPRLYVGNGYFCIADYKSYENSIHIFSLSDYQHLVSCGALGPGPNEITRLGHIEMDKTHRKMYVSDHGKYRIFSYDLDSLILNPTIYKHQTKTKINNTLFPDSYFYVNDTLSYVRAIKPTSASTFEQIVAKWNMRTGEMKAMPYSHPAIENKRSVFDVSLENNFYVEAYLCHDLLSICDLNGNLKYNIYGPNWNGGGKSKISCFGNVIITDDNIITTYSGGNYSKNYFPTKILIFDLKGDYIKTLDVGCEISDCCYDEVNNRIIMALNDEIQFGYLDLNNLI